MKYPFPRMRVKAVQIPLPWLPCWIALVMILGIVCGAGPNANAGDSGLPSVDEDQRPADTVRLSDLIEHAYAHNPSIEQAREAWRATVENYRVATGYPEPPVDGHLVSRAHRDPIGGPRIGTPRFPR